MYKSALGVGQRPEKISSKKLFAAIGLFFGITVVAAYAFVFHSQSLREHAMNDKTQAYSGVEIPETPIATNSAVVLVPSVTQKEEAGGDKKIVDNSVIRPFEEKSLNNKIGESLEIDESSESEIVRSDEIAEDSRSQDRPRDIAKIERKQEKMKRGEVKRFDQPGEAVKFYLNKRLPTGETELPLERYFEAREKIKSMSQYSTPKGKLLPSQSDLLKDPSKAPEAAFTWNNLGPGNIGGRTRALVIDPSSPDTIYAAGVAGGIWKTTNGGTSWTPQDDFMANLAVTSIEMDTANNQILYAGTGEGFFNGDGVRGAGIFKTINGGTTWTRLTNTNNSNFHYVNDVVVSPANPTHVYAATRTGVFRSLDSGVNWTNVLVSNAANGNNGAMDLAIRSDQATDYIFAALGTFAQGHIWRNTDAGGAGVWTDVYTETG